MMMHGPPRQYQSIWRNATVVHTRLPVIPRFWPLRRNGRYRRCGHRQGMPSVFTVINLEAAFFGFSTHHCVVLPSKRERARASFLLTSVLYISIITWGLCGKFFLERAKLTDLRAPPVCWKSEPWVNHRHSNVRTIIVSLQIDYSRRFRSKGIK